MARFGPTRRTCGGGPLRGVARLAPWLFSLCSALAWAHPTETKLLPLPVYATLPNEGDTYGVMPVFLVVDSLTKRTDAIYAPSITWNSTIQFTGTMRYYRYPSATRTFLLTASASTHVNRNLSLHYLDLPVAAGACTWEAHFRVEQSVFYRFFGFGPDTPESDESSYTRRTGQLSLRGGYNLAHHVNIGAKFELRLDGLLRDRVSGLPLAQDRYPQAPGMGGASAVAEGVSIRYDTRDHAEFSHAGFASELAFSLAQGISGVGAFGRIEWHTRALVQETSMLQGAARLYVNYVVGDQLPFYYQSSLGGENLLRGFPEDRFIDHGAWELDLEQRFRLFRSHIFDVVSDWRIDPFFTVGQVFHNPSGLFERVRVSGGVGFRAFVEPSVLGRIDVAYGGEGIKVYVVLGYPF